MTNKQFILLLVLVLVMCSGLFYWYGIRPALIYSFCGQYAHESIVIKAKEYNSVGGVEKLKVIDIAYDLCLRAKGIYIPEIHHLDNID